MATLMSRTLLPSARDTRLLLVKWVIALLVPLLVFNFIWNGEVATNQVLIGFFVRNSSLGSRYDIPTLIGVTIFLLLFYAALTTLMGYAVAADSGRQNPVVLWLSMLVFIVVPLIFIDISDDLFIGLSFSVLVWLLYFLITLLWRRTRPATVAAPQTERLRSLNSEQQAMLVSRATMGGFWFGTAFAVISLVIDLIYFFTDSYGTFGIFLVIWAIVRTVLLPFAGYFLGRLGGTLALRYTLKLNGNNGNGQTAQMTEQASPGPRLFRVFGRLSPSPAREEIRNLVPNDVPLRSRGARNFYLLILLAFLLFYPMLDPFFFGTGTLGRLAIYGDAGRYVILALGLNIVVGFAGLLDLGYVAFFVFGAYTWAMIGSPQLTVLTGLAFAPNVWPWLFWPMILVAAFIAALWGVLLGAPTLRLRGDYLAIVTLGFGEIIPIIVQNMDKYTGGTNGLSGIYSPAFFGVVWNVSTPTPYYYLMLLLVALVIFTNVRLRDSRLGRAWIAIREDEIAAASSGINLVRTKLFAFGAGAFFSGIAGAYYAAKASAVASSNFSFTDSVLFLSMVVLGGIGSIPGVVVGALAVYAINVIVLRGLDGLGGDPTSFLYPTYTHIQTIFPNFSFGNIRNLIFGIVLIVIMIFRPEGLIPSARRKRELHVARDEESGAADALGALPGAPGFEEEASI
ncbi:MAG TPA: branched-chain amino acid ABC transporter permease [Ktedonobacteraceae bacterium]